MTDVGVFADIYRRATADADISMSLKGNMLCHLQTNRCCISDKYWSLYVCVCVCVCHAMKHKYLPTLST